MTNDYLGTYVLESNSWQNCKVVVLSLEVIELGLNPPLCKTKPVPDNVLLLLLSHRGGI